jgi:NAD(P)-dependent dehydrogenase (short-subunit alcohol dehydrogenase family)
MPELKDAVVAITGAGRGLGAALARAFAREGARLVLGARTETELDAVAAETGAIAVPCDVTRVEDLERLVRAGPDAHGRLDVMINNAGISVYGPFLDTREEDFDAMMATNVKGAYFGSQIALRVMKAQRAGLIVNVSSIAGARHLPNESAYCASKWAVQGFTGVLHQEAAAHGVRVTSIVAGGIATPFWKDRAYVPFDATRVSPARDFMTADEVAQVVVDVARKSDRFVMPEVMCLPLRG